MQPDVIEVKSVQEEVYERLKQALVRRRLAVGEKVSIRQLAETFGVSTMPVREALRRLQAEGMVTYDRRGVTIRELSAREVQQIFEIRNRLETLAITWAVPTINVELEQDLDDVLRQMDVLLETGRKKVDVDKWRSLNAMFHMKLYAASGSEQLYQMIENLWVRIEAYMRLYTSTVASFEQAHKEHHEMLELLKEKQTERLCQLVTVHLYNTQKIILENLH